MKVKRLKKRGNIGDRLTQSREERKVFRNSVACEQTPHQSDRRRIRGTGQKMHMIGHQRPCKTWGAGFRKDRLDSFDKFTPIRVVFVNGLSLDTTDNQVVKRTGDIDAVKPKNSAT